MAKSLQQALVVFAVGAIAVAALSATDGSRSFGVVDEPLYAVNAVAIAGSAVDGEPAALDLTASSHPPFGAALLALGLLGPPIFPDPMAIDSIAGEPLCSISAPGGVQRAKLLTIQQGGMGWEVVVSGIRAALPSKPTTCVDLIDRAALLLLDGSIVVVQPIRQGSQASLALSEPIVDPNGRWISIAPASPEPDGALVARSITGLWWRIGDAVAEGPVVPTTFSGERLIGIGVVGYLDGESASLTRETAQRVIRLFDACATSDCELANQQLRRGRLLLNGDVEPASRDEFLDLVKEIGGITYGQTRIAIGVDGDQMVLLDLDEADRVMTQVPFSATRLRVAIGGGGSEGWDALLATRTRLTKMNVRVFPSPTFTITDEARFSEIIGMSPAGGTPLATIAVREENGDVRLVLVERTRLRSVTGRTLQGDVRMFDEYAVSMSGGRGSLTLFRTGGANYAIDTGSGADRLRTSSQGAFVLTAVAAASIGLLVSPIAALYAGAAFLATSIAWEQARVAMLDTWLMALLACALVAAIYALRTPVRARISWRRLGALGLAGTLVGAAAGVKLSALAVGLPMLAAVAASRTVHGAAGATRIAIAAVGALGAIVGTVGLIAGSGFGGVLNVVAGIALFYVARIWKVSSESDVTGVSSAVRDVAVVLCVAAVASAASLGLPALIGATVSGVPLDLTGSIRVWLQAALDVAEGFTLDHPLGLPFWGLAAGLGLGYSMSAAPSLLMATWAGAWLRIRERARFSDELVSLLFLIALLSIAVWAPLSRILFPWYAVTLAVPVSAAVGIAIATRARHWYPIALAAAIAPALSWLAGPTVCLASVARLDRGCQVITSTDVIGNVVLAFSSTALALFAVRLERRAVRSFGGRGRGAIAQFVLVFSGTVAALAASTLVGAAPLEGFAVVVAMEVIWALSLGVVIYTWRRGKPRVAALIGVTLVALELLRATGMASGLRAWYLVPTQVGRVIPHPLLHPVPMAAMAAVMILLVVGAVVWRRRSVAVS
jgi:hypothetical protein